MPRFMFNKDGYKRLQKCLSTIDKNPETWVVYGENVRYYMEDMWLTLCETRSQRRKLLGRGGPSRTRNAYNAPLQQRIRQEKFNKSPYCEAPTWTNCHLEGKQLEWSIARLDHIIPISVGGETTHENTRLTCANCHAKITNKSNHSPNAKEIPEPTTPFSASWWKMRADRTVELSRPRA